MSIFFAENKNTMLKSTIKALEVILVSAGLVTTVLMLKGAVIPYSCELVFSSLMGFWTSIRCILSSPLYICIVINFMVLLIAVSSNFQNQETSNNHDSDTFDGHYVQTFKSQPPPPAPPPLRPQEVPVSALPPHPEVPVSALPPLPQSRELRSVEKSNLSSPRPLASRLDSGLEFKKKTAKVLNHSASSRASFSNWDAALESKKPAKVLSPSSPSRASFSDFLDFTQESKKPARVLNHSSSSRASFSNWDFSFTPEIKKTPDSIQVDMASQVTDSHYSDDKENEEDQDTMEATWKLITGGGDKKPKKKELRKSETFMLLSRTNNNVPVQKLLESTDEQVLPSAANWKELRKSETFNDTVTITRNGGMIRRDPSMSLDEFNKQVEAFIKKFNTDMRLQRQESDQRFLEMINQGRL